MNASSGTSRRRQRPTFRIVRRHFRYPVFREKAEYVLGGMQSAFMEMRDRGYVLGKEMAFWIDWDWGHVNAIAAFIGERACNAALADDIVRKEFRDSHKLPAGRISLAQAEASSKDFEFDKLEFIQVGGNGPVPCCSCRRGSAGALDLWCTPSSKAPPLLCSEGGVVEYWRLPLSPGMIFELSRWRKKVEPLVSLAIEVVDPSPASKQARAWLDDRSSWVSELSISLAEKASAELKRPVRAFCPPYHVFRL